MIMNNNYLNLKLAFQSNFIAILFKFYKINFMILNSIFFKNNNIVFVIFLGKQNIIKNKNY